MPVVLKLFKTWNQNQIKKAFAEPSFNVRIAIDFFTKILKI